MPTAQGGGSLGGGSAAYVTGIVGDTLVCTGGNNWTVLQTQGNSGKFLTAGANDPVWTTLSGDVTNAGSGVMAIGASKVTRSMLSAGVRGELNSAAITNAEQEIDIVTLQANASLTPLTADDYVADTFTDSNGYNNTETAATATYDSANKRYVGQSTVTVQSTGTVTNPIGNSGGNYIKDGQEIVLSSTSTIISVSVHLGTRTGTPSDLTCRIETDAAGVPSGTLADASYTKTIAVGDVVDGSDNTFTFTSPVAISAATYHVVFQTAESEGSGNYYAIHLLNVSPNGKWEEKAGAAAWTNSTTYDLRMAYVITAAGTLTVSLGDLSALGTIVDMLVSADKSGAVTFDYRFNGGSYTTGQALDTVLTPAQAGGAANNNLIFNIPAGGWVRKYAAVFMV